MAGLRPMRAIFVVDGSIYKVTVSCQCYGYVTSNCFDLDLWQPYIRLRVTHCRDLWITGFRYPQDWTVDWPIVAVPGCIARTAGQAQSERHPGATRCRCLSVHI